MDSQNLWQIFLETGSPEIYLLYNSIRRMESGYVPDNQGLGVAEHRIQ